MRRTRWIASLATVVLLGTGGLAAAFRGEAPADAPRFITDDQGRALILHGLNTSGSAKSTPDSLPELTEADVAREYDDMGTNFVRFLIQWSAVEPRPGEYDDDYLAAVSERISWYTDRGYHVMLDMHQDLYSRFITDSGRTGDGAPEWATLLDGQPVADHEQWELYYLEPGVIRAFDNFWGTTDSGIDLIDHYAKSWGHVAGYFAEEPAILGYDLMNEPWGGSIQGAAFETGPLARLYQRCIDQIRSVDTDGWVFVEPQAVGINWGLPSSLPALDDPRSGEDRIGYAPHLYPFPMDLGDTYTGDGRSQVDATLQWWRGNVLRTAERLDAPVLLGEFGLDATAAGGLDYVDTVADLADETGMGWSYWSNDPGGWGPYSDKGEAQPLADRLDRPYPRAIAGIPTDIGYDRDATKLTVAFTGSRDITAPTEIYLPDAFGAGGSVDCGSSCVTSWDAHTRVLSVTTEPSPTRQTIVVTPK